MELNVQTTVLLDDYELDKAVITRAAELVLDRFASTMKDDMAKEALRRAVDERAEVAVSSVFEKGIQPTDGFGAPKGPRISIQEFLAEAVLGWLDEKVDSNGKPRPETYGSANKLSRREYLLRHHAVEGLSALAAKELAVLRKDAQARMGEIMAKVVAEKLK